jgi:outer membrane lipopolysaccharide assembly protein LptE/RlpB
VAAGVASWTGACGFGFRPKEISFFQTEVAAGVASWTGACGFGFRRKEISFFHIEVSFSFAISDSRQP